MGDPRQEGRAGNAGSIAFFRTSPVRLRDLLLARIEYRRIHCLARRGTDLGSPPEGITLQLVTVPITGVAGALFGMWVASMAGTAIPNSRLADFERDIERGRILMMGDAPLTRTQEIPNLLGQRHPEGKPGGIEPTIPACP